MFDAGTAAHARASRRAREPRRRRGVCVIRGRGSGCARPATSSSRAARSRRDGSATRTVRCCSRCSRKRVASRSTTASPPTTSRCSPRRSPRAVDECDALVTSGAVSMGDYDFVKVVLERLAAEPRRRAPTAGCRSRSSPRSRSRSRRSAECPCSGCPAIPVSSRVSFELLARPALRRLAGRSDVLPEPVVAVAASALRRRPDGRVHFDRVIVRYEDGGYVCERAGCRPATCSRAWPRPPASPSSTTAPASRPATGARAPARRRLTSEVRGPRSDRGG